MNKDLFTESVIKTSLNKAISPLTLRPRIATMPSPSRSNPSAIRTPPAFSLWSAVAVACIALLSASTLLPLTADAAPAKKILAPLSLINAMAIGPPETGLLPLQLQIESQVDGRQKLAYLPTTGPSMDFYYLNYRPIYKAGESKIDFWMLTPKGTPAPKTGSLELYDEFGKIRLAVLVPEGTEIPQEEANKNEPFLWRSWVVPKTVKAGFDFSEKFRVVLRTSDSKPASTMITTAKKNISSKRWDFDSTLPNFLLARKKNSIVTTAAATAASSPVIVQDRQFRIKGLQATPGGNPNPAMLNVNRVVTPLIKASNSKAAGTGIDNGNGRLSNITAVNADPNTHANAHSIADKPVSGMTDRKNGQSIASGAMVRAVLPPFAAVLAVLLSALAALY